MPPSEIKPSPPMQKGRKLPRVNHRRLAHVLALFMDGPTTAQEIHEETGLHKVTAYDLLHALYNAHVVHISAWEDDSRGYNVIPVYSLGQGRDARKRPRKKSTERSLAYRQRVREQKARNALAGAL